MWLLEAWLGFALFGYKEAGNNKKLGGEGENVHYSIEWPLSIILTPFFDLKKSLSQLTPAISLSLSLS